MHFIIIFALDYVLAALFASWQKPQHLPGPVVSNIHLLVFFLSYIHSFARCACLAFLNESSCSSADQRGACAQWNTKNDVSNTQTHTHSSLKNSRLAFVWKTSCSCFWLNKTWFVLSFSVNTIMKVCGDSWQLSHGAHGWTRSATPSSCSSTFVKPL